MWPPEKVLVAPVCPVLPGIDWVLTWPRPPAAEARWEVSCAGEGTAGGITPLLGHNYRQKQAVTDSYRQKQAVAGSYRQDYTTCWVTLIELTIWQKVIILKVIQDHKRVHFCLRWLQGFLHTHKILNFGWTYVNMFFFHSEWFILFYAASIKYIQWWYFCFFRRGQEVPCHWGATSRWQTTTYMRWGVGAVGAVNVCCQCVFWSLSVATKNTCVL